MKIDFAEAMRLATLATRTTAVPRATPRARAPLGEVLRALGAGRFNPSGLSPLRAREPSRSPPAPEGAEFRILSFACAAGARDYKLYIPASARDGANGLIVMLHGCKQDPDDFAVGTNMNAVAEPHGLLIAYPRQPPAANPSSCWNWFDPAHQSRDAGEPA